MTCCRGTALVLLILGVGWEVAPAAADAAESLYCGRDHNCYDVLELRRVDSPSTSDIKKAMRRLSLIWHPDKNASPEAEVRFRRIQRAHDTLVDPNIRAAYDHFLDHPEEFIGHYVRYYRAAPDKVPLWAVLLGLLLFVSFLQYINGHWRYSSTLRLVAQQEKFVKRVNELLHGECAGWARETVVQRVLDTEVNVNVKPPRFRDLFLLSLFLVYLPRLVFWICDRAWFVWKFRVLGRELGPAEKEKLTWQALGLRSQEVWEQAVPEDERNAYIQRELWVGVNFRKFQAEMREEAVDRMRDSAKFKRYKRFMKKSR